MNLAQICNQFGIVCFVCKIIKFTTKVCVLHCTPILFLCLMKPGQFHIANYWLFKHELQKVLYVNTVKPVILAALNFGIFAA